MPIFYTDSGSFNNLEISGSGIVSGALIVSGTARFTGGLTGSLLGTSSFATNATLAVTASYFTGSIDFPNGLVVTGSISSSLTNQVGFFGTSSWGVSASSAVSARNSGNGFPYDGTVIPAVISGSLLISSSINSPLTISGSVNDFFEVEVVNLNAGNNASSDFVVSSNNTTDFGNYASFGINSTTFNGPLVGGPSDAYLYVTSSVGELDFGHAHTGANSNIRLFTNGPNSTANTRVFISASGNVGIGATTNLQNRLTVNGSVSASSVTGSLTGSFAGAITHFSPSTLKITVGTTAPSSPAINDLWVDTN